MSPGKYGGSSAGWLRRACFSPSRRWLRCGWTLGNWDTRPGRIGFWASTSCTVSWSCCCCDSARNRPRLSACWSIPGDILWPTLMVLFATSQGGPFLLFFVFVLAAAAYRWGLWETFGTAMATVLLLWAESLAINHGGLAWIDGAFTRHGLLPLGVRTWQFEPKHLFMLSAYLLVMGLLLGYLAEQQKRLARGTRHHHASAGTGAGGGGTYCHAAGDSGRAACHVWRAASADCVPGNE